MRKIQFVEVVDTTSVQWVLVVDVHRHLLVVVIYWTEFALQFFSGYPAMEYVLIPLWCNACSQFLRCKSSDVPSVGRRRWRRLPSNDDTLTWETIPGNAYDVVCSATASTMKRRLLATTITLTTFQSSSENKPGCCTSGGKILSVPATVRSWNLPLWMTEPLVYPIRARISTPQSLR